MDSEYQDQLRERLRLSRRLLNERKLQLAKAGMSADPSIKIAAEDLQLEVRQLEAELGIAPPVARSYAPTPRYEAPAEPEPVFQQRMVGQETKARQHDIEHQMTLLNIHRRNLAILREQARYHGGVFAAPLPTQNGIIDAKAGIRAAKEALNRLDQDVDDLPGDE